MVLKTGRIAPKDCFQFANTIEMWVISQKMLRDSRSNEAKISENGSVVGIPLTKKRCQVQIHIY